MMMPMDEIPSPTDSADSSNLEVDMRPSHGEGEPPPFPPATADDQQVPISSATNCSCGCNCWPCGSGTSRSKVEPVIFQPLDDVYLQLKPHRRIRVIHLNSQGALPTHRPYFASNSNVNSSEDEEDYWFENADPRRLRIKPPVVREPPKRIFHKFEPQVRPTLESLSPSNLMNNSNSATAGRLPRKSIKKVSENGDDENNSEETDDEDEEEDQVDKTKTPEAANANGQEANTAQTAITNGGDTLDVPAVKKDGDVSPSVKRANIGSPERSEEGKVVITLPEPGESSTDSPDLSSTNNNSSPNRNGSSSSVTASAIEAGQKLGGMANIAFESEEVDNQNVADEGDQGAEADATDVGYLRHRDLEDDLKKEAGIVLGNGGAGKPPVILPALFFLHGVGGSANVWYNQLTYFANLGHEVVAPDLLGHGFSSAPDKAKSYTFVKLLRDTLTIFDHFIPRGREVVLVGHSYGCSLAAALTRSRPESVRLLVMLSCGGPTPLAPPPELAKVPPSWLGCLKPFLKCKYGSKRKYKSSAVPGKSKKIHEAFDVPSYVLHHMIMGQNWPEGELTLSSMSLTLTHDLVAGDASYHRKIGLPTLLVYGMKDPLVSLVEMCEMERTIPKAYLELIPLAGHMAMQDQSKQLNVMMKRFISKYCHCA